MADITLFTVINSFLPALIVTLIYTILFGEKRNQYIEAFIGLMYINAIGFMLLNILLSPVGVSLSFDSNVLGTDLFWVLFTDFMFQIGYNLQTFFTWIMVSFMAVLFGQLVIMLKLALQDPLKMRFANLIQKIAGKPPVSDGYVGLKDRLQNIRFEGLEPQPLNPEVVRKAWSESWRDYLIIGLATIIPSIGFYLGDYNPYAYAILVFATWIYRFGYPASNRIAKGAGVMLGNRNLGAEMMRGVLGWFFRLNILLSLVTIGIDLVNAYLNNAFSLFIANYATGLAVAAVPILYAILMLPLVEDFSVVLYKKVFEAITQTKDKIAKTNWTGFFKNLGGSLLSGGIVTGAFVASVFAVCVNYAITHFLGFLFFPRQVDASVYFVTVTGQNNGIMISPIIWSLMMFLIPLGMMMFLGVLGWYIRGLTKGNNEGFAFFSGAAVAVAIWFLLPGMDYVMNLLVTPVRYGEVFFYRLRPFMRVPGPDDFILRIISQFVINLPIYVSVVLFILYYFHFKESWEREIGIEETPFVNVSRRDVRDSVGLFVGGLVGSIIGVIILSLIMNAFDLYWMMYGLIAEIGNPDGLELVLAQNVTYFAIVAEHNIVRTLMMMIAGPIFWMLVLWFAAVKKKTQSQRRLGLGALALVALAGVGSYIWTLLDMNAGVFIPAFGPGDSTWPWTFAAQLGLRAGVVYGILFGAYFLVYLVNRFVKGESGGWWLPPLVTFFAIEYFVYDDQFTIIALVILPMILALLSKLLWPSKANKPPEDFLLTYIRMGLLSLAVAEVLSTALWVAGMGTAWAIAGGDAFWYIMNILPHGLIEIPAFLFAAAASIRIARDLGESVSAEEWDSITEKAKALLTDRSIWRTFTLVMFFLLIAALVEEHITWIIVALVT